MILRVVEHGVLQSGSEVQSVKKRSAITYAAVYATAGALWILVTDTLANQLSETSHWFSLETAQTAKGLAYVAFSAVLVYLLVKRAQTCSQGAARKLERQVSARTREFELSNRDLRAFSYSISHDLRAPLRAINGFAAIVRQRYGQSLDPEASHYLENISAAGERMDYLIEDLLRYAQLGSASIHLRPVQLHHVLQTVAEELRGQLDEIGATLVLPQEKVTVQADPSLLWQILSNLTQNAIRYRSNERALEIRFEIRRNRDSVQLSIADNGIGISAENQERAFAIFQRLQHDSHSGTGVGLSIARRAAEMLDGTLTLQSQPGEGATFILTLPMEGSSHGR